LKQFISEWEKLTSDQSILDIVQHCHLEIENNSVLVQTSLPHKIKFNEKECSNINNEISKLLEMDVIREINTDDVRFVSTIFLRPKRNGEFRMILNLKELNQFIKYNHFKMNTFENALKVITPNCFSPVRIRVRIGPLHPLVCRKRRLNGAVLRMRPEKPDPASQQVWHDKDPFLLKGPERRA
jgi:hypothetical protein